MIGFLSLFLNFEGNLMIQKKYNFIYFFQKRLLNNDFFQYNSQSFLILTYPLDYLNKCCFP